MTKNTFDIILITSPDLQSSLAVRELIISSCGEFSCDHLDSIDGNECVLYSKCGTVYVSTCDPYGARMGSGGGTIAALAEAYATNVKKTNPTILICHAGGESSRCPTQITLGKAWTSLPILSHHEPDECTGATYSTKVSNPTALLIEQLSYLFVNVPRGSVVVAASDVLLQFGVNGEKIQIDFSGCDKQDGVIGLAVPAPLSTAKNHGVFVVDSQCSNANDGCSIHPTYRVLQKPSVDEMREMQSPACTFLLNGVDSVNEDAELQAWIDTGVITFLPGAAAILRELSTSTLKACTRHGLQELHNTRVDESMSVEAFAKENAPKICLYSDMLHSLQTTSARTKRHHGDELMSSIHDKLSKQVLLTCTIPSGAFIHLGTTCELLDFLTLDGNPRIVSFGESIGLTTRASASLNCFERNKTQASVVLNTHISGESNRIGRGSVLEHCLIENHPKKLLCVQIGDRCLVSGLRPIIKKSLRVPSGICLQLLPLKSTSPYSPQSNNAYVCLCYGVDDDIKASPPKTLFGIDCTKSLSDSFQSCLWDNVEKQMIWNAKLMPVFVEYGDSKLDISSFLEWVANWIDGDGSWRSNEAAAGFAVWKESKRISLSELRHHVDSASEILHRKTITNCTLSCKDQLLAITERSNEIVNFVSSTCATHDIDPFQLSEVREVLIELESLVWRSARDGNFDVVGRCFMTIAILLSDVYECLAKLEVDVAQEACSKKEDTMLASLMGSFWDTSDTSKKVLSIKDGRIGPYTLDVNDIQRCWNFLEKAASTMTGRCVRGNTSLDYTRTRTSPISIGTAVIASAPARIDLHGGWSDTPPISYEHGGAVAVLAVTVDDQRPLRAKCRLVKGMDGIMLRTESRTLSNGELVASSEVRIRYVKDLKEFSKPQSKCSLLKCALICLGLVTAHDIAANPSHSIQSYLNKFCQRNELDAEAGLEVVSTSLLPTGSGMGGSSILSGCVLAAIAKCIGITLQDDNLVHAVLMLENIMSTGGGWQDQIGGLFGGLKLGTSDKDASLKTKVQSIDLTTTICGELGQRLVLVFTGKPRLAKNILQNVLRRWARRSSAIADTVHKLVQGAHEAVECLAKGDLDRLGSCISSYWDQKQIMAGAESGVEPDFVGSLLTLLLSSGCIVGGTLCGAGGGGFLALLLAGGKTMNDVKQVVNKEDVKEYKSLSWHTCSVDQVGLSVHLVDE